MLHRLFLTVITIFFPPLTVLLLTGLYTDTLINSILFLCGVIPSHIHAFYISCTYFHRRRKVRKGMYPGGPKPFIYDRKISCGGVSERSAEDLRLGGQDRNAEGVVSSGGSRRRSTVQYSSYLAGDRMTGGMETGRDATAGPMLERRPSRNHQGYGHRRDSQRPVLPQRNERSKNEGRLHDTRSQVGGTPNGGVQTSGYDRGSRTGAPGNDRGARQVTAGIGGALSWGK